MEWFEFVTLIITIPGATIGACWFMHRENIKMYQDNAKEMKDFHGRLCALEEKYIQIMQRILEKK